MTAATSGNVHMPLSIRSATSDGSRVATRYHRCVATSFLFSSAAFFARPLGETFRLVAETGFAGVEVMVTKDPTSQDPRRMRELAAEHGVTIGAIHAPCLLRT